MRVKVFIIAPRLAQTERARETLLLAGYDVNTVHRNDRGPRYPQGDRHSKFRETHPKNLSSKEIRQLAEDIIEELLRADVLVTIHDRTEQGSSRGSSAWAGFAYAHEIPTVVLGPFDEPFLYLPDFVAAEVDDVVYAVEKALKRRETRVVNSDSAGNTGEIPAGDGAVSGDNG